MERKTEALAFLAASMEGHQDLPVAQVSSIITRRLQMHQQQTSNNESTASNIKSTIAALEGQNLGDFLAEVASSSSTSPANINSNTNTNTNTVTSGSPMPMGINHNGWLVDKLIIMEEASLYKRQRSKSANGEGVKEDSESTETTATKSATTITESSVTLPLSDENSTSSSSSSSSSTETNNEKIGTVESENKTSVKDAEGVIDKNITKEKDDTEHETENVLNESKTIASPTNLESTPTVAPTVKKVREIIKYCYYVQKIKNYIFFRVLWTMKVIPMKKMMRKK